MSATRRDYYEILGVARSADKEEIKKSFRRLARQFHPDVNKTAEAEAKFKEINEAYEVLSDDQRRAAYDRFGHAAANGQPGANPFEGMGGFPFGDIFETFFGASAGGTRTGGRTRAQRGADRRLSMELEFREAIFGVEREVQVDRLEECGHCHGGRAEPGTGSQVCPTCRGTGEVRRVQQTILGQFVNVSPCERCYGEGRIITTPCSVCRGEGRVRATKTIAVTIPAGVEDGAQMRLSGEGDAGLFGGPPGNLYIQLRVAPDPVFQRDGDDLLLDLPINIAQAALGAELEIPTLEGTRPLRIPDGTQSGHVIRLRGQGVPHLRASGRGDLVVTVRVQTPTSLTGEQRELLERLATTFGTKHGHDKGFFEKFKDALGLE